MKTRIYSGVIILLLLIVGCGGQEGAQETGTTEDTTEALAPGATEPGAMGAAGEATTLEATLAGDAEVPGPGDPDGSGTAEVELSPSEGTVCFEISVENIAEAQAAHIHSGGSGESGPPVVNFDIATNGLSACVDADQSTINSIIQNPSNYYVNVHNEEYGGGAVRGQLEQSAM